ncbi:DNA polymerase IV [Desulfocurvus sp. DL9XJH121]
MAERWIMHVDMDAFYASVEQMDDPDLRGRPVAVGGGQRGVVSAASYEARAFGVRSAMPLTRARRLCPDLVLVPVRMARYQEVSARVMAVIRSVSPQVEQTSVDEAYVDLTGTGRILGSPLEAAERVRAGVREATGLTCSVGLAPLKFLAKIASDLNKPDGVAIIRPHEVRAFLDQLPVGGIPGVGPKAAETLRRLGVRAAGDMLSRPRDFWERRLGERGGVLYDRAAGLDPRPVEPHGAPKSSSAEVTLDTDTADKAELTRWLMAQAERVGRDLRGSGLKGRTVTLKIKYEDFKGITRSHSLEDPTDSTQVVFETARDLLDALRLERRVRLIGVGVSQFGAAQRQMSLLQEPEDYSGPGRERLDAALDAIRDKFGGRAVERGMVFGLKRKK